jgi:uncharacterized damage-inducible protein DinB
MRTQLAKALDWGEAHADFDAAVKDFPPALRGRRLEGLPYSAWQILEHLRIAQHDILDFSRNAKYKEMKWPDDYWPSSQKPPSSGAWDESVRAFKEDRQALQKLAADTSVDLEAKIPHGEGQTYMRELVLVIDHTAYHVGQLVLVRRLLGLWKA